MADAFSACSTLRSMQLTTCRAITPQVWCRLFHVALLVVATTPSPRSCLKVVISVALSRKVVISVALSRKPLRLLCMIPPHCPPPTQVVISVALLRRPLRLRCVTCRLIGAISWAAAVEETRSTLKGVVVKDVGLPSTEDAACEVEFGP